MLPLRVHAALLALGALGLFSLATPAARAVQPRVFKVRALGEPGTLDWNRASTWVEGFVLRDMMEGLVSIGKRLEPLPALAESWTVSADNRVYTFHLRPGVKWSDGEKLTARQFVDSWQRLLAPETGAKYASFLFDIEGAEAFHKGETGDFGKVGVKAEGELTLQVRLRAPNSFWYWIPSFHATYPIRLDLIKARGKDWDKTVPLATVGAFTLKSYDARSIVLARNPNYYGKRGNLDEIDFALVPDDSMALKMYEDQQIDLNPKLASMERGRLRGRADFRSWADVRVVHLRLNTAHGPTANVNLRRAIGMAIDRSKLSKLFDGVYQPASSFVPPGLPGYGRKAGLAFSVEKAREELKKSGFDAARLPPLDLLSPSFDDQVILAQFIQDELRRNLGLNVRIHILEPKRYYAPDLVHADYAMQINFWGADYPDPDDFFTIFLGNSGLNRYGWSNLRYDELVTQARSVSARPEREKRYLAAQRILLEESVATIPLYYGRLDGLVRGRVKGFDPGPFDWGDFKGLSLK